MGVNVKLGENTINNVNSVELNDAVSGKHLFNLALNNTINFIADNTDYSVVSVKSGVDITAPKTPLKSGYVFKGWGLTDSATSYTTYYCDIFYVSSNNTPFNANVGNANANNGAFCSNFSNGWSATDACRLCLRPIQ